VNGSVLAHPRTSPANSRKTSKRRRQSARPRGDSPDRSDQGTTSAPCVEFELRTEREAVRSSPAGRMIVVDTLSSADLLTQLLLTPRFR
jgi:hypothetical protein